MLSQKVTELDPALALTGNELVYIAQGLTDKRTTTAAIAALGSGGTSTLNNSWIGMVTGFAVDPAGPTTVTGGVVYTYTYTGGVVRYRFIANDNSIDAFYSSFDGFSVSVLIATKALTF